MVVQANRFPNDMVKIGFVASYLRGAAASWYISVSRTPVATSFPLFVEALHDMFGDQELVQNAIHNLSHLVQGKS